MQPQSEPCARRMYASFSQREDLTTRLKNILDEYPPGAGPYKEFLQNADDAQARQFAVCLDRATYPRDKLLAPAMAQWQGPALLVWNSSTFSESDFESISHVGQSGKYADASKIGKYGLGFNVAYHFSDVPSFVSRDQLVAFDPHARFLPDSLPGLRCSFPPLHDHLADQLKPFARFDRIVQQGDACQLPPQRDIPAAPVDGTIFRLPLRTPSLAAASLISPGGVLTPAQLLAQLREFSHDGAETLLFLKHVEELSIWEQSEQPESASSVSPPRRLYRAAVIGAEAGLRAARMSGAEDDLQAAAAVLGVESGASLAQLKKAYRTFALQQFPDRRSAEETAEFDRVTQAYERLASSVAGQQVYRLSIRVESLEAAPTEVGSAAQCPSVTMQEWRVLSGVADGGEALATQLHQVAKCGVAARRRIRSTDFSDVDTQLLAVEGRAYCFLPLPIKTGLPVHVNAAFALTSNRRDLWRGDDERAAVPSSTPEQDRDDGSEAVVGDGSGQASSSSIKVAWNTHLLAALGKCYADLIELEAADEETEHALQQPDDDTYALWPDVGRVVAPFDICALSTLRSLSGRRRVFYDPASMTFRKLDEVTFIDPLFRRYCCTHSGGDSKILPAIAAALQAAGMILIDPPAFVRAGLDKAGIDVVLTTPQLISDALRRASVTDTGSLSTATGGARGSQEDTSQGQFSVAAAAAVLTYLMHDWGASRLQLLDGLPLIPLANGGLGTFQLGRVEPENCCYCLERQFVAMFEPQMATRLVDASATTFMQLVDGAAFQNSTNVKRLTLTILRANIHHILPPAWRGQQSVQIGASSPGDGNLQCGTAADVPAAPQGEHDVAATSIAVVDDEQELGWSRPRKGHRGKKKKKQKQPKRGSKTQPEPEPRPEPESEPEPVPAVSNLVLQQRLRCFWAYVTNLGRAQQLDMKELNALLADSWPLVAVGRLAQSSEPQSGGKEESRFELEFCISYVHARRRLLLRSADYSIEEAQLLTMLGVLFLPPASSQILSGLSLPRRDACRAMVHSYHLGPCAGVALARGAAVQLRELLLGWQRIRLGGHEDDETDLGGAGGWQIVEGGAGGGGKGAGLVLVSAKQFRQLPVFETISGEFWPVDADVVISSWSHHSVAIRAAVVSPSPLWDKLTASFGEEIVRIDDAGRDEQWLAANDVARPEELTFFSRWLVPRLKKSDCVGWMTKQIALALLAGCGEAKVWNDKLHGHRLMDTLREVPLVCCSVDSTPQWRLISAFIDPFDEVFQHIYRDRDSSDSALYPPPEYSDNRHVIEIMRHVGMRSMSDALVFCETARAVKPHDLETGRVLVRYLAHNSQLSWTNAEWSAVLNIPFLPAIKLARCSLPPQGILSAPTEHAISALRRRFNSRTKSGGGAKASGGRRPKLAQQTPSWMDGDDLEDGYDDEEEEDPMLDDIMRSQIMLTVEQLTAEYPPDHGSVDSDDAMLIKASQARSGGACLPQMAWLCWTCAFVLDPIVDDLPHKISQNLQLQPYVPLNMLLSHLATIVRQWSSSSSSSSSPNSQSTIRFRQGLILFSLLEIHETLCKASKSKLADQQHRCKQVLGSVPLCLFDDSVWLKPAEVYVDLDDDISPSTRAPPRFLRPFYYLLMALGAPTVPTEEAPKPNVTQPFNGILTKAGCRTLLGFDGTSDSISLTVRHPLTDCALIFGGQRFYVHALVVGSACEVLRHSIFGLNDEAPGQIQEPCAGGPSLVTVACGELLQNAVKASTFEAMLLYLYTGCVPALGRFGRSAADELEEFTLKGGSLHDTGAGLPANSVDGEGTAALSEQQISHTACELLRLADHFMLEELRQRCECCLAEMVDVHNACDLLALAHSCHAPQLVAMCKFCVLSMHHLVMKMEAWGRLPEEMKHTVLRKAQNAHKNE